jgi:hypothetical protein
MRDILYKYFNKMGKKFYSKMSEVYFEVWNPRLCEQNFVMKE